jgi:hypothetical protein
MSGNYKLTADITVTAPIGYVSGVTPVPFTGDFDGNGHTVTLNITSGLTVSGGPLAGTYAGLFAALGDLTGSPGTRGLVHDLTVAGTINITGATVYVGGVAGGTLPSAAVSNVASSVTVSASGSGDVLAGGIVGVSQCAVSNVYATGNVSATTSGTNAIAGGIVGASSLGCSVSYAYATGAVSAIGTGTGAYVGSDDCNTVVAASGIGGGGGGATVGHTVALNSSVSASDNSTYKKISYRISHADHGTVTTNGAANYGDAALTPTGSSPTSQPFDPGADQQDGVNVTVTGGPLPTAYTAPDQTWWTNPGFSGADWTTVWEWDTTTGLPKLR